MGGDIASRRRSSLLSEVLQLLWRLQFPRFFSDLQGRQAICGLAQAVIVELRESAFLKSADFLDAT
jgi:hypothetical protein